MVVFFFQAEDGIRDKLVTGVQTCALPISNFHSLPTLRGKSRSRYPGDAERLPSLPMTAMTAQFAFRTERHPGHSRSGMFSVTMEPSSTATTRVVRPSE